MMSRRDKSFQSLPKVNDKLIEDFKDMFGAGDYVMLPSRSGRFYNVARVERDGKGVIVAATCVVTHAVKEYICS